MGLFSCLCGSSSQRRRDTTTTKSPPLQPPHLNHGSLDQSIDDDDDDGSNNNQEDIRAVKSWREKRTTPPTTPTASSTSTTTGSTALVIVLGDDRKLATIEEGMNDSRNTSIASLPSQAIAPTMEDNDNNSIPSSSPGTYNDPSQPHEQHQRESWAVSNDDRSTNVLPRDTSRTSTDSNFLSLPENTENGIDNDHDNTNSTNEIHNAHYGGGGFPTLSPQEEEWRKKQQKHLFSQQQQQQQPQQPQDDYLSSSSNSTIEDPILVRTSNDDDDNDNDGKRMTTSGPIDLDDDDDDEIIDPIVDVGRSSSNFNQMPDHDDDTDIFSSSILSSSSSKRPGPDETDTHRPNHAAYHPRNHPTDTESSTYSGNSSLVIESSQNTTSIVPKPQHWQLQEKSRSSSSSILRDKEPELYSINNSAESEELDAMVAAIDNSKSDKKVPPAPLPATVTKDSHARTMMTRSTGSNRNSQSSPTLHLTASQQSSPSLHSGSRNSVPSIKLSPNRRDSPSVHDPTSYMVPQYNDIIATTEQAEQAMNRTVPALISPSSDGSNGCFGPLPATTTPSTTVTSRRGRSATSFNSQQFIDTSTATTTTTIVNIPETAQQRRKARSQSRGRRIRERARTLLSSYNDNQIQSDINQHPVLESPNVNGAPVIASVPTIIQSDVMEDAMGNMIANQPQTPIENTNQNDHPFHLETRSLHNSKNGNEGLSVPRSLGVRTNPANSAFTINEAIHPMDVDHSDRLSDIPSEVDPMLRERYLKACRILKSSLLEKDATIRPSDKAFLSQLLSETTPSKDEDDINESLTEEKVRLYESTVHNTLLERSTPLFDTATTVVTDDFSQAAIDGHALTTYRDNGPTTNNMLDNSYIDATTSGESSGVTEQELQIHNYVMHAHYDVKDSFHPQQMPATTTTASQVSSSVFSRVDGDYPYTVIGLDNGRHSKVLLPWMMNALRGFFPLEISNHNFWLKYHLDRNTDINHEDSINLLTLLSKVQNDTYTILCVETVDGYVFGAFCSTPWEIQSSWYGSGDASFLWRLKHPRRGRINSNGSNAKMDDGNMNEIEIYPYTRYDSYVQYCSNQTLAVGGGTDWTLTKEGYSPYHQPPADDGSPPDGEQTAAGIGFLLDGDLMGGETNSCVTYANPRLGKNSGADSGDDSNEFDIQTIEVYTFTKFSANQEV